jgi:3-mercaptopropionate dioxygenase
VVPSGSETPIQDHLAWGLVGIYRGTQDQEICAQRSGTLELVERRSLVPGDFYVLIPRPGSS